MMKAFREAVWGLSHRTPHFRGKERLVAWLSRPRAASLSTIERAGVNWQLYGHDFNEFVLAIRKSHSEKIATCLENEIENNAVRIFWDIGANIGTSSLPLLKRFPTLQSMMFEPSAEVAGRLIQNVAKNPELAQRARLFNVALSQADGIAEFFVSSEPHNSGTAGLGQSHNRMGFSVTVQTRTGDSLVNAGVCPVPQLVKMDVEGFEWEVLKGMSHILQTHKPTIVFEHSVYRFTERGMKGTEVIEFLQQFGYRIMRMGDGGAVTADDLKRDDDFVAKALT